MNGSNDMAKCEYCGKEIKTKSHKKGGFRKYCDKKCMALALGRKEPESHGEKRFVVCNYCGNSFLEKRNSPNIYCSHKCAARSMTMVKTPEEIAQGVHDAELENEYEQLLNEHRKILGRLEAIRFRIEHEKYCKVCGQLFVAEKKTQITCSEECSRKNTNRNKDKRIYKNGTPDLSITLTRLYLRDKGVCQICGREIDFDCDPNSKYYPSIDHIRPIAKGGLHTWDNVQLACRKCNTLKSDDYIPPPSEI